MSAKGRVVTRKRVKEAVPGAPVEREEHRNYSALREPGECPANSSKQQEDVIY